jgi:hypothetical protein
MRGMGGDGGELVRSYLKTTGKPVALMVDFAGERADYRRIGFSPPSPLIPLSPFLIHAAFLAHGPASAGLNPDRDVPN